MVKLSQHDSPHYGPRTFYNAVTADVTIAIAVNFNTAGEVLTKKACSKKPYMPVPIPIKITVYKEVVSFLVKHNARIVNIAGNSLSTLEYIGQDYINLKVYHLLSYVNSEYEIFKVISGGQTGVDFAAGVACGVLGIPCEMKFPKGYRQRLANGEDITQDNLAVRQELKKQILQLKKMIQP